MLTRSVRLGQELLHFRVGLPEIGTEILCAPDHRNALTLGQLVDTGMLPEADTLTVARDRDGLDVGDPDGARAPLFLVALTLSDYPPKWWVCEAMGFRLLQEHERSRFTSHFYRHARQKGGSHEAA